jgi:hypothetical protein
MLSYADCVMLRRKKKLDASQGAFINHVDDWKHRRMYLDGGAGNFDQQQHLVRKKEAAIRKNDAGLIARRLSCLKRLWRSLLPLSDIPPLPETENRSAAAAISRDAPELLTFILPTRIVSALYVLNQSMNPIHQDLVIWPRGGARRAIATPNST